MTWRLRVERMKNRDVVGLKVSHVLSFSAFCEKEQNGRGYERGGGSVGSRWGERKKGAEREKRETKEPRESQRHENRRSPLRKRKRARTYTRTYNTVTHRRIADGACTRALCMQRLLVNTRVPAARVFYTQESPRGHAADRRLNHASYFTSGRGLAHAYFSISIYHSRVFHRTRGSINVV